MMLKFAAVLVMSLACPPLLVADEPMQRATSIEERLVEAELSAVVKVYEKTLILKLEAGVERQLLSESADKSDELKYVAAGKRIAALDLELGKLRKMAERCQTELLSDRAGARAARPTESAVDPFAANLQSVRVYKLNQLDDNLTEHAFTKMFNQALESAGLDILERPDVIERGSDWLRVKAAPDQFKLIDHVMSIRHDAPIGGGDVKWKTPLGRQQYLESTSGRLQSSESVPAGDGGQQLTTTPDPTTEK